MLRSTRVQSVDALSSMATICGYKAVIISADRLPKFFSMLKTAAGTIPPAQILVIRAGVADCSDYHSAPSWHDCLWLRSATGG